MQMGPPSLLVGSARSCVHGVAGGELLHLLMVRGVPLDFVCLLCAGAALPSLCMGVCWCALRPCSALQGDWLAICKFTFATLVAR